MGIVKTTTADISPVTNTEVDNNTETETSDIVENTETTDDSLKTVAIVETVETTEDTVTKVINTETETLADVNTTDVEQTSDNTTVNNTTVNKTTVDNTTVDNTTTENTEVDNTTADNTANNTTKTVNTNDYVNYAVYPISQYTATKPIPVNPELPNGIVFKVQIGAFKRPIRQNAFSGLSPIAAEKIPGSLYTRYLAGMFMSYEGVRTALGEIKTIGYKDAFIVAYRDGKRIPLYIARGEAKKNISNYSDVAATESANVKSRNKNAIDLAQNSSTVNNSTSSNEGPIVVAKDIKKTAKLLYTVQIGVYKKAVPHSRLYNLSPIYEEQTQYGFIRYTTGIFSDRTAANAEKNRIRKIGIKDAFVTAYYEGKKISLQKAASLKSSNVETENNETVNLPQVKVENNTTSIDATKLYYKVQIGAYKEQIPVSQVASWLSVARKQDLKQFKDERGYTVFAVGNYKSYDEANWYYNESCKSIN